jgi:hypothetical protein
MMEELTTLANIMDIAKDATVIMFMAVGLWVFYKGMIISRPVYTELTEGMLQRLCVEFSSIVKEAIEEAIRGTYNEMNGKKEEK